MRRLLGTALLLGMLTAPAAAQSIASRVAAVRSGWVAMDFAARPGVCGQGTNITSSSHRDQTDFWENGCDRGPVRVLLRIQQSRVSDIDTYVGGQWREDARLTRLGTVSAPAAAEYLMGVVETADPAVARRAIMPAQLADSTEPWPRLLRIARDPNRPAALRKDVVFWLSQGAADVAVQGLDEIVADNGEDRSVKESAVFAISRLGDDKAVPRLIDIARTNRDPAVRRQAVFWLGRSGDERALSFIEQLLLGKP